MRLLGMILKIFLNDFQLEVEVLKNYLSVMNVIKNEEVRQERRKIYQD